MNRILTCALLLGLACLPILAQSAGKESERKIAQEAAEQEQKLAQARAELEEAMRLLAESGVELPEEAQRRLAELRSRMENGAADESSNPESRREVILERVNADQIRERIKLLESRVKIAKERGLELTRGVLDELEEQKKLLKAAEAGEDTYRLELKGETVELEDLIKRLESGESARPSLRAVEMDYNVVWPAQYGPYAHTTPMHFAHGGEAFKVVEVAGSKLTMMVDSRTGHSWYLAKGNRDNYEWKYIEREAPRSYAGEWPSVPGPGTRGNRGPGFPPVPPSGARLPAEGLSPAEGRLPGARGELEDYVRERILRNADERRRAEERRDVEEEKSSGARKSSDIDRETIEKIIREMNERQEAEQKRAVEEKESKRREAPERAPDAPRAR